VASLPPRGFPLALAAALGTAACAAAPRPLDRDDGWTDLSARPALGLGRGADAPTAEVLPAARRKPWPYAGTASEWQAAPGRDFSDHGGGAYERSVRVDSRARGYLTIAGVRDIPEGARVLESLHPIGSEKIVAVFAMRKLHKGASPATNDWAFAVLDEGLREAVAGDLSACARCHADAPHGGWFGPPRPPTEPPAKQATTQ